MRYALLCLGLLAFAPAARAGGSVDANAEAQKVADGFIAAVELCGNELAQHFPPRESRIGKLPDRVYVI